MDKINFSDYEKVKEPYRRALEIAKAIQSICSGLIESKKEDTYER